MKRFRYLAVGLTFLLAAGGITAVSIKNSQALNVQAADATISSTPAANEDIQKPSIKFSITAFSSWAGNERPSALRFNIYNVKTVFDDDNVTSSPLYKFDEGTTFKEYGDQYGNNGYGSIQYMVNPIVDENNTQQRNLDNSIYKSWIEQNTQVSYSFPWWVESFDIEFIFQQWENGTQWLWRQTDSNNTNKGAPIHVSGPGLYELSSVTWKQSVSNDGNTYGLNVKYAYNVLERTGDAYETVNNQYASFLEDYYSLITRGSDGRLTFCDINTADVTNLTNLLEQYNALDPEIREQVNVAGDIWYEEETDEQWYISNVERVMAYLNRYLPILQREASLNAALTFNGNRDNSLLIVGVGSVGLLSAFGVAYFVHQKKKRA